MVEHAIRRDDCPDLCRTPSSVEHVQRYACANVRQTSENLKNNEKMSNH